MQYAPTSSVVNIGFLCKLHTIPLTETHGNSLPGATVLSKHLKTCRLLTC